MHGTGLHVDSLSLVLCVGEGGYLKGSIRGNVGWFPAECVEEVPTPAQEERPCELSAHKQTLWMWLDKYQIFLPLL